MIISFSNYVLIGKEHFPDREGALLRFEFEDGSMGYADCHPWEQMGDFPLLQQLSQLTKGIFTPLTNRSLAFARLDAEGRAQQKSLFSGLSIPPSHWLMGEITQEVPEDFAYIKLKVGRDPAKELPPLVKLFKRLPKHTKVRLDFNCLLTKKGFEEYIKAIEPFIYKIDFIEDPFPYVCKDWEEMQETYGVRLACDHLSHERLDDVKSHAVTVLKPAVQEEDLFRRGNQKLVVTSYLDHPLGQVASAYVAAKLAGQSPDRLETCGLLSHLVYQTNEFSERLKVKDTILQPPCEGTGFGFDDLLLEQDWEVL